MFFFVQEKKLWARTIKTNFPNCPDIGNILAQCSTEAGFRAHQTFYRLCFAVNGRMGGHSLCQKLNIRFDSAFKAGGIDFETPNCLRKQVLPDFGSSCNHAMEVER